MIVGVKPRFHEFTAGNLVYILLAGCLNVVLRLQYHLIKGRVEKQCARCQSVSRK